MHLTHGDAGVRVLFARCFAALRPGGVLVLEHQTWDSYRVHARRTALGRARLAAIRLRPARFGRLLRHEIGFASFEVVAVPAARAEDPPTRLFVYHKPAADSAADAADPGHPRA